VQSAAVPIIIRREKTGLAITADPLPTDGDLYS
jgi:hypothetical protein